MRPIYVCVENFRESLSTPTATFADIFLWDFIPFDPMNVRTKFEVVALPISEIIGVLKKFGKSVDTPTLLLSQICNGLLFGWSL